MSQDPRAKSQDPRAKSQHPRPKSLEPRAKSLDPRVKSQEPRSKSQYTQHTHSHYTAHTTHTAHSHNTAHTTHTTHTIGASSNSQGQAWPGQGPLFVNRKGDMWPYKLASTGGGKIEPLLCKMPTFYFIYLHLYVMHQYPFIYKHICYIIHLNSFWYYMHLIL